MKGLETYFANEKKEKQDQQQSSQSKPKKLQSDMAAIKKAKPIERGEDNHDDLDEEEGVVWPNDEEQSSASGIETQAATVTH